MISYAKDEGLTNLIAYVSEENIGSIRTLEKNRFSKIGIHTKTKDFIYNLKL